MKVTYRPRALADIDEIFRYLEKRSPTGARNVISAILYFRSAVRRSTLIDTLVPALEEARTQIEQSIEAMRAP